MSFLAILLGVTLALLVLWDTFETMILPRTVTRRLRLTRMFYLVIRAVVSGLARVFPGSLRDWLLFAFGPMSLILLFVFWALCLILSFALIHWGLQTPISVLEAHPGFGTDLYFSGTTFLTLGLGDVTARTALGRTLSVLEAGIGFGFLAIVVSYLPVLYQSFSRREVSILLLDARAGTPPTAGELLRRHGQAQALEMLRELLREKERWAAELLESYLSYPMLASYRSQHEDLSWLGALTAILDTCALIQIGFQTDAAWRKPLEWQAHLTFAMARHTIVDLAYILNVPPIAPEPERLTPEEWKRLCEQMAAAGIPLRQGEAAHAALQDLRQEYEPFVNGLARRLSLTLPPWYVPDGAVDNWQVSAWDNENHL